MRKIRKSKKGQLADTSEVLVAAGILVALILVMLAIIWTIAAGKKGEYERNKALIDASYDTRMILNTELAPNYKLYQAITDDINANNYDKMSDDVKKAIELHYGKNFGPWFFIFDSFNLKFNLHYNAKSLSYGILSHFPLTQIPNGGGEEIGVVIKRINPEDYDLKFQKSFSEKLSNLN